MTSSPAVATRRGHVPFVAFVFLSALHVVELAAGLATAAEATKVLLMPALALAVLWTLRGRIRRDRGILLLAAIALSWLGDAAGTFFSALPTLPLMLAFFALAHLCYIALFLRRGAGRPPIWTLVYVAWWLGMLALLWPHLGALTFAVAGYGLVLGGTAATAARCGAVVAIGGALFLASDTILSLRLFLPDVMPGWTSPAVMVTYCLGQGLIAWGILRRTPRAARGGPADA